MPTVISQLRAAEGGGIELRVWEAPDTFELEPDPSWVEQPQDPASTAMLSSLASTPAGWQPPWQR